MLCSKLTRQIGFSKARPLIAKHDIKQRTFYGNTSMEAEMGFLMAGQALVSDQPLHYANQQPAPGKIIYDPFAGTGSLLYAVAHWGAYVFGSDIDGRQMRGKSESSVGPGAR
jgi:tRNA (guanine10-N2)-methyltransferase